MNSAFKTILLTTLLLLLVGWLDYVTGPELGFFVFYFLPISMAAWRLGRAAAVSFAVMATLIWFIVEMTDGHVYSSSFFACWNGSIRLAAFLAIAAAVCRSRGALEREKGKVKKLSGFLPICASCKKIRDDEGYWHQVENYIRTHSEAEFTHSICPACAEKLYPEWQGKSVPPDNQKTDAKGGTEGK